MTREEKIEIIADILEMDDEIIKEDTILEELETWDSVAVLAVISVINEKFDRYPIQNIKEPIYCFIELYPKE